MHPLAMRASPQANMHTHEHKTRGTKHIPIRTKRKVKRQQDDKRMCQPHIIHIEPKHVHRRKEHPCNTESSHENHYTLEAKNRWRMRATDTLPTRTSALRAIASPMGSQCAMRSNAPKGHVKPNSRNPTWARLCARAKARKGKYSCNPKENEERCDAAKPILWVFKSRN